MLKLLQSDYFHLAKFNLNVLRRINQELDGNFDVSKFAHHAIYNEDKQRVEIYLRSLEKQIVTIPKAGISLKLEQDELIHTEHSHKYFVPQIKKMMESTGFNIKDLWLDEKQHYAVVLTSKN